MTHSIHPDAEAELGDATVYCATHASHAIAEAFLAEYERVRDLIIQNQQRGPQIFAVAHQSREPGYWGNRT